MLKKIFLFPIYWYQRYISPGLPASCKYYPTCSQYAINAIQTHGVFKGTILISWRLLRCNPWSKGGVDHVPSKGAWPSKPLGYTELLLQRENEAKEQ